MAVALAAEEKKPEVVIVKESPLEINDKGYSFSYELSDGQIRKEVGTLKQVEGAKEPVIVVKGTFSFVNPVTGERYTVDYDADENGFRPVGAHLPVAPKA